MKSGVRLYVIQARDADRAVVFRRGPSKRVLLLAWNTRYDTFEDGQWLKGRIYERRCDLSPNGELLIYFAASFKRPLFSWSAVSRPPFLTALALWPKGDAWGGGGLFETPTRLLLNHPKNQMELADGFRVPKRIEVRPFGPHSGGGEDYPVWFKRLERDGWSQSDEGWEKPRDPYVLRMAILGVGEKNGPWYLIDHTVVDKAGKEVLSLGESDWADWSKSGDLLFAKDGKLWRLRIPGEPVIVADFSDRVFEEREPSSAALQWPNFSRR